MTAGNSSSGTFRTIQGKALPPKAAGRPVGGAPGAPCMILARGFADIEAPALGRCAPWNSTSTRRWTNFITHTHPHKGEAVPHMLTKDEQANPYRSLQPSSRDFVAVLAR